MKRRKFLKIAGLTGASALMYGPLSQSSRAAGKGGMVFPRYRGFNLLEKFTANNPMEPFREKDFQMMAEWGFDFARIPMSYWNWTPADNWYKVDEAVIKLIDDVVELGRQYKVHVNLNMHRIPGYCINGRDREPFDLFNDTPENMQKALDASVFLWRNFAARYKGIPSSQLSFDLINEPPRMTDETRYIEITRALVDAIRQEDPERLIVADGKSVGRDPVWGIVDLGLVQSTRGYDPMIVSHYQASWIRWSGKEEPPEWPHVTSDGTVWDKEMLRKRLIEPWRKLADMGVPVHVGEWGAYNRTPHDVALRWMHDLLGLWREQGWGHALWNFRGAFGILDSNRQDVVYEDYYGHKLDRRMLEVLIRDGS